MVLLWATAAPGKLTATPTASSMISEAGRFACLGIYTDSITLAIDPHGIQVGLVTPTAREKCDQVIQRGDADNGHIVGFAYIVHCRSVTAAAFHAIQSDCNTA